MSQHCYYFNWNNNKFTDELHTSKLKFQQLYVDGVKALESLVELISVFVFQRWIFLDAIYVVVSSVLISVNLSLFTVASYILRSQLT